MHKPNDSQLAINQSRNQFQTPIFNTERSKVLTFEMYKAQWFTTKDIYSTEEPYEEKIKRKNDSKPFSYKSHATEIQRERFGNGHTQKKGKKQIKSKKMLETEVENGGEHHTRKPRRGRITQNPLACMQQQENKNPNRYSEEVDQKQFISKTISREEIKELNKHWFYQQSSVYYWLFSGFIYEQF